MQLTYKFRLTPTKSQRTRLQGALDACRWVYNQTLATRKEAGEARQESVSYYDAKRLIPTWKTEHLFLRQAYSQCLQNAAMWVDLALKAFFRRVKAGETSVPRGNPPLS
jgi:putative transposase